MLTRVEDCRQSAVGPLAALGRRLVRATALVPLTPSQCDDART